MTTSAQPSSYNLTQKSGLPRIASIDIFRGLTMVVMIFVNDLASVRGLPWWNYHMKANVDAMTYVDMVFPFFLFIVGLSIPLAVRQRSKKNASMPALWLHVFTRAASLIALGLILANAETGDKSLMGIDPSSWALLALAGAALFLGSYGSATVKWQRLIRVFGLVLAVAMFAIFRRTTGQGRISWIDGSYPEILGLIGYTYLAVSTLYILARRFLWAPLAWFVALLTLNALCTARWVNLPHHLPLYFWPFGNGAMSCISMAGVVTSVIFFSAHCWQGLRQRILMALAFGFATLVAGWFLVPLGISKIRATPTWCLYSIGAAVLLFSALYWICDVKKHTAWAFFARPAGSNTLLTYLLPDFYYFIIAAAGISYFERHFNFGSTGAVRSALFTVLILVVAAALNKLRIRLQL